jgi:hypothetical protein
MRCRFPSPARLVSWAPEPVVDGLLGDTSELKADLRPRCASRTCISDVSGNLFLEKVENLPRTCHLLQGLRRYRVNVRIPSHRPASSVDSGPDLAANVSLISVKHTLTLLRARYL